MRRSDFIVHWTGAKDIEKEFNNQDSAVYRDELLRREKYIERLKTTLDPEHGGLWMNYIGIDFYTNRGKFAAKWPATCFTEIKLSSVEEHADSYGYLGFGFSRKFIMQRFGSPVQYVPGPKELSMGAQEMVPKQYPKLYDWLKQIIDKTTPQVSAQGTIGQFAPLRDAVAYKKLVQFIHACDLKDFSERSGYDLLAKDPSMLFVRIQASIVNLSLFVKAMSDDDCERPFQRLDEVEWRVPYVNGRHEYFRPTGAEKPPYKLLFSRDDLKLLVFPDQETRDMAMVDSNILASFSGKFPTITTVRDCQHF